MFTKSRKVNRYRRKGQNLITANKIKPENWDISDAEAKEALKVKNINVKEIKKIRKLKHQVCISFWDDQGNICSSFFSYRIFSRWQQEVEETIDTCPNIKEWARLNRIIQYEFAYYKYLTEMQDVLNVALENRMCVLKATEQLLKSDELGVRSD